MAEQDIQMVEDTLLEEQIRAIQLEPVIPTTWSTFKGKPSLWADTAQGGRLEVNEHRFDRYADKQLHHLVVTEEFDFLKIAQLLNYTFREGGQVFTERTCRERWAELCVLKKDMKEVREQRKEGKRITSILGVNDPYCLYDLEELIEKMKETQAEEQGRNSLKQNRDMNQVREESLKKPESLKEEPHMGYNIFKNSIRKIEDMEEFERRERAMKDALRQAQQGESITDKLMLYKPTYGKAANFQMNEEELSIQQMREMLSREIEITQVGKELVKADLEEDKYQSVIVKRAKDAVRREGLLEENWDQYESD